jgi:hypothetical protein
METKTIVKVISLYDVIADNLLILLATLHHIIIIIFNYYYIYTLEDLIDDCDDLYCVIFEEFFTNLEYCQGVTIVTFALLFIVVTANDNPIQLNQNRVFIMCASFIVKLLYSAIQFWNYSKHYVSLKESDYFQDPYITVLLVSYDIRFMIIPMALCFCIGCLVFETIPHIIRFTQNYKFIIVERKKIRTINARNS